MKTQFGQDCGLGLNYTTEDYLTADANDMCAAAMKYVLHLALVLTFMTTLTYPVLRGVTRTQPW